MQIVKVGNHTIEIFSDIEEMQSWRFMKFNKFVLIDSNIGATIEDVDRRFQNLYLMAKNEENDKIKNEINNLRQSIYFVLTETNTSMMSFIALINKVDGEYFNDLSDDGIKRMQNLLKGMSIRTAKSIVQDIKKKSKKNSENSSRKYSRRQK